ncbi:hypothetical protein LTSEADE_4626, partial [Salmonella enterica subsp. enterica serovar Adelaide str. A4-669]
MANSTRFGQNLQILLGFGTEDGTPYPTYRK